MFIKFLGGTDLDLGTGLDPDQFLHFSVIKRQDILGIKYELK